MLISQFAIRLKTGVKPSTFYRCHRIVLSGYADTKDEVAVMLLEFFSISRFIQQIFLMISNNFSAICCSIASLSKKSHGDSVLEHVSFWYKGQVKGRKI